MSMVDPALKPDCDIGYTRLANFCGMLSTTCAKIFRMPASYVIEFNIPT